MSETQEHNWQFESLLATRAGRQREGSPRAAQQKEDGARPARHRSCPARTSLSLLSPKHGTCLFHVKSMIIEIQLARSWRLRRGALTLRVRVARPAPSPTNEETRRTLRTQVP